MNPKGFTPEQAEVIEQMIAIASVSTSLCSGERIICTGARTFHEQNAVDALRKALTEASKERG